MTDKQIKWCDLSRFGAVLRVVPNSPLRGIPMTCLEVRDERVFERAIRGNSLSDAESSERFAERSKEWWEGLKRLDFGRQAEFFEQDHAQLRGYRLYSTRPSFTLTDLQSIVPDVSEVDFKLMPVASLVLQPASLPEMLEDWKNFAETVLANEAVGVWALKDNPFNKSYAEARPISVVFSEHEKAGCSPVLRSHPISWWFANALDKAHYRENALTAFYADLDCAHADGLQRENLQEVTLPYCLPLLVEKGGRIVALRDVRYAPEIMGFPPSNVFGQLANTVEGVAVKLLRESHSVEAIYREEMTQWQSWCDENGSVDSEAFIVSVRRAVDADVAFCARFSSVSTTQLNGLIDGNKWVAGDVPQAMKPFFEWCDRDFNALGMRARMFVRDSSSDVACGNLVRLNTCLREQDAGRAKDAAKEALRRVAEVVQVGSDESRHKVRHEDAGVKIGGARKDFGRRAMSADDLEGMSDFERNSLVVKKNVWPPLNYEAMRDAGVSPQAAMAIKYLKDSIAVEPDRKHSRKGNTPDVEYVNAVSVVRDSMANVKTLDEFAKATFALYKAGRGETNSIYGGSNLQIQLGSDTCNLLYASERKLGWSVECGTEACVPGKITREIAKRVREGTEWNFLIKPKREKSDADKEADSERSDQERELHRPHLDVVERIGGADWRGGRDVTADDLMEHFGFRAVEFGNWLPQDERQTVLNMSFDSLCDLADALNLPPRGIALNGELAVAFGSRGRGGKNAALAHFEPGRFVINLTRMKGAGTLAHEWFHALDFHLANKEGYLTKSGSPRFDGDPMPKLVGAMVRRSASEDEVLSRAKENAEKGKVNAVSWCYQQSGQTREVIGKVLDEYFDRARMKFYEVAAGRFAESVEKGKGPSFKSRPLHSDGAVDGTIRYELAEEIVTAIRSVCDSRALFTKVVDKVEGNINWMLTHMARWVTVEAARDIGVTLDDCFFCGVNVRETDFMAQAKKLDERRSSPYWATEIELFARAGAQFVYYELADKGVRSDYLVYGSDEERYLQNTIGNPNPIGVDRLALREHFQELIDDYRMRLVRTAVVELESSALDEP